MTKKKYDWEGVKQLPLGTKFTEPNEEIRTHYEFSRKKGRIILNQTSFHEGDILCSEVDGEWLAELMLQDTFEVVDCKHDEHYSESGCSICGEFPNITIYYPCREYVTLGEALANVATGKWQRAAYDSDEWHKKYVYIGLNEEVPPFTGRLGTSFEFAISGKYQDAKWYEVKE